MGSFEQTREYQQSLRMRPACNRVLCEVFGVTEDKIIRFEKEGGPHVLDREFAIDLKVLLPSGGQVSGQEKALSFSCYKWKTFTIEFWQNRKTQEPGEWFKIASQFYLSGYSDASGCEFVEWKIVHMLPLLTWLRRCNPQKLASKCKASGGSRAAFLPIPYNKLPSECIFAAGAGAGKTEIYLPLSVYHMERT
jgi:hypothetical protein